MKPIKSANGVRGCLIRSFAHDLPLFRVTDENGEFRDYVVTHYDVDMVIDDDSAHFYEQDGEFYLDYSPDVMLGDALDVYNEERLVSKYDKGATE